MNKENKLLIGVLLFAVIIFSIYLFHDTLSPDEASILWQSKNLKQADEPFVPVIIAFFDIFMSNETAGRLTILLFSLIGVYIFYLLGKEIKDYKLGIIALSFLILNPWYWMMTNRVLFDIPLTVMLMLTGYYLYKMIKYNKFYYFIFATVLFFLAILTKHPAVMFFPVLFLFLFYYLFKNKKNKYAYTIIPVFVIMSFFAYLFIGHDLFAKYFRRVIRNIDLTYFLKNLKIIVLNSYELLLGYIPQIFIFFMAITIIYLIFLIFLIIKLKDKKTYMFLLAWVISVLGFRFFFGGDIVRYILPALPALLLIILLSVFDMFALFNLKIKRKYVVCFLFFVLFLFFIFGLKIGHMASFNDTGWKEAGNWIKENYDDGIIYAGSLRQIRYYSGMNYTVNNGSIYARGSSLNKGMVSYNNIPEDKSSYLIMDFREKFQPDWIFRANKEKAEKIALLNYSLKKVIYDEMPFYIMPPNKDRNDFLNYFNIIPYIITENNTNIYIGGASTYMYNFDNGKYINELGFKEALMPIDYAKFMFTKQTILKQPVVLIFRKDS